jgi:hypothetical protein
MFFVSSTTTCVTWSSLLWNLGTGMLDGRGVGLWALSIVPFKEIHKQHL